MKKTQPIKNNKLIKKEKSIETSSHYRNRRKQKYGTSKLEAYFAQEFLDKLGIKYIYEYEAKDIGRYFDFAITSYDDITFITEEKNGITSIKQEGQNVPISFMIEVDGGYW